VAGPEHVNHPSSDRLGWAAFEQVAPSMAAAGSDRFDRTGLVLVGTIRRDGTPRISPVEPLIAHGELWLGMMPRSTKALDLLRDPRVLVHSIVSDKDGSEGEFKLRGRAEEVRDPADRARFETALREHIGWSPEGTDYHLFTVSIESAVLTTFIGGEQVVTRWTAEDGERELKGSKG
jgi:hypothetical protein